MSIFKKIKKGWKKLGSSIAKRMRTVGRGVKKGFAKITKAFGKLGPLGHLALFFILPGVGNALTSWMGQMGSSVMNMLPENFAKILTSVGNGIKSAASMPGKAIGSVYNTVSNALTAGIDFVTKPFMEAGSKGLATSFKDFVGETAAKFSATPPVEFNLPDTLPDAATPDIFDEGYKLPKESTPGVFDKEYKLPKGDFPKGTTDTSKLLEMDPDTKGIFRKGVDKLANVKDTVRNKDILGTGVSVGEAVGVSKDATQVFTAYKYFNPDDVESGFYNPNIGMANALNESTTNPYTTSGENANFVNLNNVPSSPDQQASFYASMFGPVGNDPYAAAMNAPGYGFGFEDYITGA
jgi:hypothetical protein